LERGAFSGQLSAISFQQQKQQQKKKRCGGDLERSNFGLGICFGFPASDFAFALRGIRERPEKRIAPVQFF